MKPERLVLALLSIISAATAIAQTQTQLQPSGQTPNQGADSTQSLVSPFGLGTGATLAVTSQGTSVAAAVERQMAGAGVNFWQVGLSGTIDKNGQQQLYSSSNKDAPGFKGKFGIGRSSFIRPWLPYTAAAGKIVREAMCRDLLDIVNKSLRDPATIPPESDCAAALELVNTAYAKGLTDTKAKDLDDLILGQLKDKVKRFSQPTPEALKAAVDFDVKHPPPAGSTTAYESQSRDAALAEQQMCNVFKDFKADQSAFNLCPAGNTPPKPLEDVGKKYPALYHQILAGEPGKFQWKIWGSWAPTLSSVDYRAVTNGVADLADKHQWTQLLNSGVGDIALYYGKFALGAEGGFGQTMQVTTQNVCNTTTSGTYTAQSCDMAMIGKPNPTNAWMASTALQVYPIAVLSKSTFFNPGLQINYSYVAPTTGGHSSELAIPFYLAPSASPIKFVFGVQPTWDWNTNPKIGNKFAIALFVGARPEITK